MKISMGILAGVFLLVVLFLAFGGKQFEYNGLSRPLDTSVIGEAEPVQIYIDGLE